MTNFYVNAKTQAIQLRPLLGVLKDDYSLGEIFAAAKALDKHPLAYNYFYGTPLPRSYDQLRSGNWTLQVSVEKEIGWYSLSIVRFSTQINIFVQYRDLYENAMLMGDYSNASSILDKIDAEVCYSFWGMEQRFIVAELSGGLKSNKDFLSAINNSSQDIFVTTFAYFFSNRSENKMSIQRFNNFFNNFFQTLGDEIREYFLFVANSFSSDEFKELEGILSYHSLSSVIDRYLTFVKTTHSLLTWNSGREFLPKIVLRVNKVIHDRLIDSISLFLSAKTPVDNMQETINALDIFDLYSKGNYQEAIVQSKSFILRCPSELSIYEIYIKSHLFLKKEFVSAVSRESLVSEVLDNMYNILRKNEATSQSITNILKIATTLQNTTFGHQLYIFYNRSILDNKYANWKYLDILNSQILNPLFVKRHPEKAEAENYFDNLKEQFPGSVTVALFNNYLEQTGNSSNDWLLSGVPDYRKTFYKAEFYKEIGETAKAIGLYNELLDIDKVNIVIYEEALVNLLDCYYKTERYEDYLNSYVQHHFFNPNLLIRVEIKNVVLRLQLAKFRNVLPSIQLPIFFSITKQDSHNINIALRVFLKGLGLVRSADLKLKVEILSIEALKFLLSAICTPEILKYSTYFENANDILLERVEVLQILVSIDKANSAPYDAEINKISQDLAVSDAIRQIDESKIYVDEVSLINSEFTDVRNNFTRYIEISKLISDQGSSFIDISLNRKLLLKVKNNNVVAEDLGHSRVSKNVKFELFKDVFFEIRDQFLFNNRYGLEVYVSTRIRHGTLLGQFRNEFLTQHLITQKEKSSENYYRNEYWDDKLTNLDDTQKNKIQELLSAFSENIDKTANKLKEQTIQIKTEDRNRFGLFDYTIPSDRLLVYYDQVFKEVDVYTDFVFMAMQFLWRLTEVNLEYIRQYISEIIKKRLIQYLSDLETDLRATVQKEKDIQELINSITTCKTQIHLELDKIAAWFRIRKINIPDFELSKVINSSLEITNKISQNAKIIAPDIDINSPTLFKGKFFIHLFDLLRIFLENIVNYAELDSEQLKVVISAQEENEVLHFRILNNLDPDVNRKEIQEKFKAKRDELIAVNWDMNRIRKEKDTGFYKAKKNLTSDLQDEKNYFDFNINETDQIEINIFIHTEKLKA